MKIFIENFLLKYFRGSFRCEKKKCNVGEVLSKDGACVPLTCRPGFEPGPFSVCQDIDECRTNPCSSLEQCENTPGTFFTNTLKYFLLT